MKKTVKTSEVIAVYNALRSAKLSKMEDSEKFAVVRAMRVLKPVVTGFDTLLEEAREKLKPEDFEQLQAKVRDAKNLSEQERDEVETRIKSYNDAIERCMADDYNRDMEIELDTLSDEALSRLAASNSDMTVDALMHIADVIGG